MPKATEKKSRKRAAESSDVPSEAPKESNRGRSKKQRTENEEELVRETAKPKRGRGKKAVPVEEPENNSENESPEPEDVKKDTNGDVEKEQEKPKRGRTTKKVEKNDEDSETEIDGDFEKEQEKPKRGRTTKKVEKNDEDSETEIDGDFEKEQEKPKRGRTTKKVEKNDEDSETEIDGDFEKEQEKPKRGRTTKKVEKNDEDSETEIDGDFEKEQEKPKRGKTTKKLEKNDEDSETEIEPPKPKRGRKAQKGEDKKEKPLSNKTTTSYNETNFECSKKNAKGNLPNMKISCWNVAGIQAWLKKDCLTYLEKENPDIFCLQETKVSTNKVPEELKNFDEYKGYWVDSTKAGYAGVALFSKTEPIEVKYGIGNKDYDNEGRCITAEYDKFYLVAVYVPNAGRNLVTLPKRLEWNEAFKSFVKDLDAKKPVIICGDMNVAHNEIDLKNPKTNKKNAGFTQEERDGMTDFLSTGFVDTFRKFYPDQQDAYTFWAYFANSRAKNVGWRLDYFLVSDRIMDNVCDNVIRSEVYGSDHCPIVLFLHI